MAISVEDLAAFIALQAKFPGLAADGKLTSSTDKKYNCIEWAAGNNQKWRWPEAYWPGEKASEPTLAAFVAHFQKLNYETTDSEGLEPGFERIALFVDKNKMVKHAARQLPSGIWTSKLGKSVDISHQLRSIEGDEYGIVAQIMRRPIGAVAAIASSRSKI